jgi:hypothetical protein
MKHRKLRIAWSVAWGVVAVLVCVLWVRSYEGSERIFRISQKHILLSISSDKGTLTLTRSDQGLKHRRHSFVPPKPQGWKYDRLERDPFEDDSKFSWRWDNSVWICGAPNWLFILACVLAGIFPWIRWPKSFSLRALLLATTLVAALLGLVVALLR